MVYIHFTFVCYYLGLIKMNGRRVEVRAFDGWTDPDALGRRKQMRKPSPAGQLKTISN